MRALRLVGIGMMEGLHRLRHDLGRELVVFVSSLVLLATFLYVFNDFLNVQVASLSAAMRERFAEAATGVVLSIAFVTGAGAVRRERHGDHTLRRTAAAWGEERPTLLAYLLLRCSITLLVVHGIAWYAVQRWLIRIGILESAGIELLLLLGTGAAVCAPVRKSLSSSPRFPASPVTWGAGHAGEAGKRGDEEGFKGRAILAWRLSMLQRSRSARVALALAVPFLLMAGVAPAAGAPPFVAAVAALAAGYLASCALAFQCADDAKEAWVERGFGVTHDQIVGAYERLAWGLGLGTGALAALLFLLGALGGPGALSLATLSAAGKALATGALPSTVVPLLAYQIDVRRPAVTLLVTLIAALFVGTAILAHWLGLLLIPLLRYYALKSQAGRFYRA